MYCSVPQIGPPLATLALVKSAITPSLPLYRPQLRVQKDENNAFDDFQLQSGRMLFINVAVPCRVFRRVFDRIAAPYR